MAVVNYCDTYLLDKIVQLINLEQITVNWSGYSDKNVTQKSRGLGFLIIFI